MIPAESRLSSMGNRQRWLVAIVLVVTLVAGALIATQLMAGGAVPDQATGDSSNSASAGAAEAEPAAGVGQADPEAEAEKALRGFLGASDKALQRADGTSRDVSPYATQAMIDEVRNESLNLEAQKIEQTGTVTIVKVSTLESGASEVVLGACLSTTTIKTVDEHGSDLRASQKLDARSMHHYTVTLVEGVWKVSAHSFPDNADC